MLAQSLVLSLLAVNAALAREINMMIGWTHVAGLNSWQFWPYTDGKYDTACVVQSTWTAEIYAVPDVNNPPRQLAWAIPFLDEYWRTDDGGDMPYPGDFYDFMHRDGFRVIATPYERLPWAVKQWRDEQIEKNTFERKFIAVKDDVAFFAPGVVTLLLPLFAGQDVVPGNDACESDVMDLKNYHNTDKIKNRPTEAYTSSYSWTEQTWQRIRVHPVVEKRVSKQPEKDVFEL